MRRLNIISGKLSEASTTHSRCQTFSLKTQTNRDKSSDLHNKLSCIPDSGIDMLFDTVNMSLESRCMTDTDISKMAGALIDLCEHKYDNGVRYITGHLPSPTGVQGHSLKVTITSKQIKLGKASLCKWLLGNNLQLLSIEDIRMGIEAMSDLLHQPMYKATMTRLDLGCNIEMAHLVSLYLKHLGEMGGYERLAVSTGSLYYQNCNRQIVIYDKIAEQMKKKGRILPEFQNKHLLRYELQIKERVAQFFDTDKITADMLYDIDFLNKCVDKWLDSYLRIKKLHDITIDFSTVRTLKELYSLGLASLIDQSGGELAISDQIKEAQMMGGLTNKEAYNFRKSFESACNASYIMKPNELICELDSKIIEAAERMRSY